MFVSVDQKAQTEINDYVEKLAKSNPKLADLIARLWEDVQADPEKFRDTNVSQLLEELIFQSQERVIKDFSDKWRLEEEKLAFVVDNYNPRLEKQNGEVELRETSNYPEYKVKTTEPVSRLRYWRTVKADLEQVMEEEILPLKQR